MSAAPTTHYLRVCALFMLCIVPMYVEKADAAPILSVHFDIEPASLPEWSTNQQGIISQYLDLLEKIAANKGSLGFSVDTSIAYNFINVTRRSQTKLFYQWIVDTVDVPVMMMYRNFLTGPNGILALTQPTIDYAKSLNKKAVPAIETNNEDPPYITFYGSNTSSVESFLVQVKNAYAANTGFGGVAVHDYTGYKNLKNTVAGGNCTSKALWEWDYKVATTATARNSYFTFAKQRCVTTTYLESEYLVSNDVNSLSAFWNQTKTNNMGLHLLFGAADWAYTANHPYVLSLVQKAVAFSQRP